MLLDLYMEVWDGVELGSELRWFETNQQLVSDVRKVELNFAYADESLRASIVIDTTGMTEYPAGDARSVTVVLKTDKWRVADRWPLPAINMEARRRTEGHSRAWLTSFLTDESKRGLDAVDWEDLLGAVWLTTQYTGGMHDASTDLPEFGGCKRIVIV